MISNADSWHGEANAGEEKRSKNILSVQFPCDVPGFLDGLEREARR